MISLAVALPLVLARYPPLHDYYHWMFVGHVVSHLLTATPDPQLAAVYEFDPGLPPNAAAPLGIGLLALWMPAAAATRIFAVACVLGFAFAFAYLVRTVQRRPTAFELAGFFWTNGYLVYNGFLSDQFALAPALVAVACLHRALSREGGPRSIHLAALTLIGTATYLCHLLAWPVVAAAIGTGCAWLLARRRFKSAMLLAATQLPVAALLLWYALTRPQVAQLRLYEGWVQKTESLIVPLAPFLRTDPFPSVFPVLLANVLFAVGLVALAFGQLERPLPARANGLLAASGALVLLAGIISPFRQIGEAHHPNSRLILPGMLVLAASLSWRELGRRRAIVLAAAVILVSGAHVVQFRHASDSLAEIRSTMNKHVAPETSLYFLRVRSSHNGGACSPNLGSFLGTDAPKWFDLERVTETGSVRTRLMQTSLVRNRPLAIVDHWVDTVEPPELDEERRLKLLHLKARHFKVIALVGCPADVAAVREPLGSAHEVLAQSQWISLLRGAPAPNGSATGAPPEQGLTGKVR